MGYTLTRSKSLKMGKEYKNGGDSIKNFAGITLSLSVSKKQKQANVAFFFPVVFSVTKQRLEYVTQYDVIAKLKT